MGKKSFLSGRIHHLQWSERLSSPAGELPLLRVRYQISEVGNATHGRGGVLSVFDAAQSQAGRSLGPVRR